MQKSPPAPAEPVKFGTFGGVFTPNLLTILGVIMFLRTGWVVGNAGLKESLQILLVANLITLLTGLSLSSIATNLKVGGGGVYFLISRSLGLEVGGAVGVPLFLAQAVSVAFYIIGFTESLHFLFPAVADRMVSGGVLAALFVIAWVGADIAIKTQYLIMAALGLSLVSFFGGWTPTAGGFAANWTPAYENGQTFWTVFAIFFPAVTGIMSGVSMSGDLKEPAKSIPRGTLTAIGITFFIYVGIMVWLALNASREELLDNKLVMQRIAFVGPLIFAGLWAATLSSALASLLAAPRTLQALAQDRVVPRFLARGHGPTNEPRMALVLSFGLAAVCLLAGGLDVIAPVITMFFLASYGTVNLAAGLSALAANPSYRPTFRAHWALSLAGAAGCFMVMLVLNPLATIASAVVIAGLFTYLKHRQYQTAWGDEWSGIWFAVARLGLLKLAQSRRHRRNWRPVILVLVGNPATRQALVSFAHGFEARRGLLFLAHIVTGDWSKLLTLQDKLDENMEDFIRENRLSAVAKTVLADDFEHGVSTLLQVSGVGALEPNTVLIGWSEDVTKRAEFTSAVRRILQLKRNLLVYAEAERPATQLNPRIDVWWRARANGSFMLTLAHLLGSNPRWRNHTVRIMRVVGSADRHEETVEFVAKFAREARIDAEPEVIVSSAPLHDVIIKHSGDSEVCFIGIKLDEHTAEPLAEHAALVDGLKGHIFLAKSWDSLQ
jgi:amino acid transporter